MNIETGKIEMEIEIPLYTAYYSYSNKIVIGNNFLCCHTNKHLVVIDLLKKKLLSNFLIETFKVVVIHKRWCLVSDFFLFSILDGFVYYLNVSVSDSTSNPFL